MSKETHRTILVDGVDGDGESGREVRIPESCFTYWASVPRKYPRKWELLNEIQGTDEDSDQWSYRDDLIYYYGDNQPVPVTDYVSNTIHPPLMWAILAHNREALALLRSQMEQAACAENEADLRASGHYDP